MSRVVPYQQYAPGQHPKPQKPQQSHVFFDVEDTYHNLCRFCYLKGKLIIPCACSQTYHQLCLLDYIRRKVLKMKHAVDLNQIRCKKCKEQFKVQHTEIQRYSCGYYCYSLQKNWCQKNLVILIGLVLLAATFGTGLYFSAIYREIQIVSYIAIAMLVCESITLLAIIITVIYCVRTKLRLTQITLSGVHQYRSSDRTSSQDTGLIYSQYFEVIIDENASLRSC